MEDVRDFGPCYGDHGSLTHVGTKTVCHVCGGKFVSVGVHARKAHDLTPKEYRKLFGLAPRTGLVSAEYHDRLMRLHGQRLADAAKSAEFRKYIGVTNSKPKESVTCRYCGSVFQRIVGASTPATCRRDECKRAGIRDWHTGRRISDDARRIISEKAKARGGRKWSDDARAAMRMRRHKPESKAKAAETRKRWWAELRADPDRLAAYRAACSAAALQRRSGHQRHQ